MAPPSEYSDTSETVPIPGPITAPAEILHGNGNIWIQQELIILNQLLPEYIIKRRKHRQAFINNTAIVKIQEAWGDRYMGASLRDAEVKAQWKKKRKQIRTWFQNHAKGTSKVKDLGFKQTITFSSVVDILHKKDVLDECDLLADGVGRGSQAWFKCYRKALQNVRQRLTEAERLEVVETVEKYKDVGYPKEYQTVQAYRYGRAVIKKVDQHRFKTMGMRCITFECHYNDEGEIVFGMHDNSPSLLNERGQIYPTLTTFNEGAVERFKESYMEYARNIWQWDTGNTVEELKFRPNDLGFDSEGLPVVPGKFLRDNVEPLAIKREILRIIVNKHYEIATEGRSRSAPWKDIQDSPRSFYLQEFMPAGINLRDPSHLKLNECKAILKYWRERQDNGGVAFRFSHVRQGRDMVNASYPIGRIEAKPGKAGMTVVSPMKKGRQRKLSSTTESSGDDTPNPPLPDHTPNLLRSTASHTLPSPGPSDVDNNGETGPPGIATLPPHGSSETQGPPEGSVRPTNLAFPILNSKAGSQTRRPIVRTKGASTKNEGVTPLFLKDPDEEVKESNHGNTQSTSPNARTLPPETPTNSKGCSKRNSAVAEEPNQMQGVVLAETPLGNLESFGRGLRGKIPKKQDAYTLAQEQEQRHKEKRKKGKAH
ncbi:hypothetical protein CPC08DRAFT_730126 [Agrocybe pediades]|nr:hypothetical protein CPC08DRAFT_730126 [Agrocybe pediades]